MADGALDGFFTGATATVLFLTALATAMLLLVSVRRPWSMGQAAEWQLYGLSWLLGVPAAAAVAWWGAKTTRPSAATRDGACPAWECVRALGWLASMCGALYYLKRLGPGAQSSAWLAAGAVLPAILWLSSRLLPRPRPGPRASAAIAFGVVPAASILLWAPFLPLPFNRDTSPLGHPAGWPTFLGAVAAAVAGAALMRWREGGAGAAAYGVAKPAPLHGAPRPAAVRWTPARWAPVLGDCLAVAAIASICADTSFQADPHHQNWFLGPANDLLRGKALMVDTQCVYGIGPPYLFALADALGLAPVTYGGADRVICGAYAVQFALLYLLLARLTGSRLAAAAGIPAIVAVTCFGAQYRAAMYPSTGPIRFGPPLLLAGLMAARFPAAGFRLAGSRAAGNRTVRRARGGGGAPRWLRAAEALALGTCMVWNLESMVFGPVVFAAVVATSGAALWHRSARHPRARWLFARRSALRLAWGGGAGVLLLAAFAADTWRRSGRLPDVPGYFAMIRGIADVSALPIRAWDAWPLVAAPSAVFGGLFLAWVFVPSAPRRFPALAPVVPALVGFGALAAAQYTYYVGRSDYSNLFHVSTLPLLALVASAGRLAAVSGAAAARDSGRMLLIGAAVFGLTSNRFEVADHYRDSYLGRTLNATGLFGPMHAPLPTRREPPAPVVEEGIALVNKHVPASRRVFVCVNTEMVTEIHLRTATTSPFASATPTQTQGIPALARAVLAGPMPLKDGDVIVALERVGVPEITAFERDLLLWIAGEFDLEVIERTPGGVAAVRLRAKPRPAGGVPRA